MTNNDNTLVLFVNEYKEKDTQPDYKGKGTVNGTEYKAAGWKKVGGKTNATYISIKLTPVEEEAFMTAPVQTAPKPKPRMASEDDIPF